MCWNFEFLGVVVKQSWKLVDLSQQLEVVNKTNKQLEHGILIADELEREGFQYNPNVYNNSQDYGETGKS